MVLFDGPPLTFLPVQKVKGIHEVADAPEEPVKAGEQDQVDLARCHIGQEPLELVAFRELRAGNAVINICVYQYHVRMRADIIP